MLMFINLLYLLKQQKDTTAAMYLFWGLSFFQWLACDNRYDVCVCFFFITQKFAARAQAMLYSQQTTKRARKVTVLVFQYMLPMTLNCGPNLHPSTMLAQASISAASHIPPLCHWFTGVLISILSPNHSLEPCHRNKQRAATAPNKRPILSRDFICNLIIDSYVSVSTSVHEQSAVN